LFLEQNAKNTPPHAETLHDLLSQLLLLQRKAVIFTTATANTP
jgi:hypothetical protein